MAVLVLINGAPGVGKSTIAEVVAQQRPMAPALDVDGLKHSLGQWNHGAQRAGLQARRLALAPAERHLTDGHDVILGQYLAKIDFIEELDALASRCSAAFVEVLLTVPVDVLSRRLAARRERPDRPEHTVNNTLVSPGDAQSLADSLTTIPTRRPRTIQIDGSGSIEDIVRAASATLPTRW